MLYVTQVIVSRRSDGIIAYSSDIQRVRRMAMQPNMCKRSLTFNKFDLRLLAARSYKENRLHIAIVQGSHELYLKQSTEHIMLQIDPIYTIEERSEGKFNKRRILEHYDTHFLFVSGDAARCIRHRWQDSQKESTIFVVSFTEKAFNLSAYNSGQGNISALILIPRNVIYISNSMHEAVYYRSASAQTVRYRIPDIDVLKLIRYGSSVMIIDVDQFNCTDLAAQVTTKLTRSHNAIDKSNLVRNLRDFPKWADNETSSDVTIFDELVNVRVQSVMVDCDCTLHEFYSRGPYDYVFQACYHHNTLNLD